jgi:hypothetical protein
LRDASMTLSPLFDNIFFKASPIPEVAPIMRYVFDISCKHQALLNSYEYVNKKALTFAKA